MVELWRLAADTFARFVVITKHNLEDIELMEASSVAQNRKKVQTLS